MVDEPEELTILRDGKKIESLSLAGGESARLTVTAEHQGKKLNLNYSDVIWTVRSRPIIVTPWARVRMPSGSKTVRPFTSAPLMMIGRLLALQNEQGEPELPAIPDGGSLFIGLVQNPYGTPMQKISLTAMTASPI